jgi:hypothetical protein
MMGGLPQGVFAMEDVRGVVARRTWVPFCPVMEVELTLFFC